MLFALTNGRFMFVDFTSVEVDDTVEVSDTVLHIIGELCDFIDFAANSVAVMIETLEVEEGVVDVGEDGADGEEADGVPGCIIISGKESIEDFSDWLSKWMFSEEMAWSVINEEILSVLISFLSRAARESWLSKMTVFSDSVDDCAASDKHNCGTFGPSMFGDASINSSSSSSSSASSSSISSVVSRAESWPGSSLKLSGMH